MNGNLFSAIRGPIILITVGTLFAVDNLANIGFDRTWPVLIIVIGLMKLLEHSKASAQPPYQQPYQPYQQPYQPPYQGQSPYGQTPPPPSPAPPTAQDPSAGGPRL